MIQRDVRMNKRENERTKKKIDAEEVRMHHRHTAERKCCGAVVHQKQEKAGDGEGGSLLGPARGEWRDGPRPANGEGSRHGVVDEVGWTGR